MSEETKKKKRLIPNRVPIRELEPEERVRGFDEVVLPYTREEAIEEANRCLQCAKLWCMEACPIYANIKDYVAKIAEGDFEGAYKIIVDENPLASCLGRVCYHFCEDACVIGKKGEPLAIRHLKRAAMDYGAKGEVYEPEPLNGHKVAVVGAGPAGLMVAWYLARKGYEITVFEADQSLGGLMTQTIPKYRLPEGVFEEDMKRFEKLPIKFETGVKVGKDLSLEDLLDQGYEAVFVGIGTHRPYDLRIPGEDLKGVHKALDLLKKLSKGEKVELGKRVAVIGGGDVAIDSVRTALRLGADKAMIVYRRAREQMPASDQEIAEAEAEGVEFHYLLAPVRVIGEDHVEGLEVQRMELGEPDESGRRRPVPIEGSEFVMDVDTVIVAIGQMADLEGFPDIGMKTGKGGILVTDSEMGETEIPGVFAAGGTSVIHAMAAGKRAAVAIDEYIQGKS